MANACTPEPFEADDGFVPFEHFLKRDCTAFKAEAMLKAIEHVLAVRGMALVGTEWLKNLGRGLYEFRVRHTADEIGQMFGPEAPVDRSGAPEAVMLRLFVHFYGDRVVLLLGGYDKGGDPSERRQQREIAEARKFLAEFKEQQRRQKKAEPPARARPAPRRRS